jgi:hypothetical protein
MKHILALAVFCVATTLTLAVAAPKPLKVFTLAGQSSMDGQVDVSTINFLGEGWIFILPGLNLAETILELTEKPGL